MILYAYYFTDKMIAIMLHQFCYFKNVKSYRNLNEQQFM